MYAYVVNNTCIDKCKYVLYNIPKHMESNMKCI